MVASTLLAGVAIVAGVVQVVTAVVVGAWAFKRVRAPERPVALDGIAVVNAFRATVVIGGVALVLVGLAVAFGLWADNAAAIAVLGTMAVQIGAITVAAMRAEPYEDILWGGEHAR